MYKSLTGAAASHTANKTCYLALTTIAGVSQCHGRGYRVTSCVHLHVDAVCTCSCLQDYMLHVQQQLLGVVLHSDDQARQTSASEKATMGLQLEICYVLRLRPRDQVCLIRYLQCRTIDMGGRVRSMGTYPDKEALGVAGVLGPLPPGPTPVAQLPAKHRPQSPLWRLCRHT